MRIAQISPLYESVPPKRYGGTERVVHYLTEELVRLGHEVTLYASGDSETSARLVPCCPGGIRLSDLRPEPIVAHLTMIEQVLARRAEYDLVHFHIEPFYLPILARDPMTAVTTLHGRLDFPEFVSFYERYARHPFVSISDAQRAPLPGLDWRGTVHHGLPRDLFRLGHGRGGYLAFLGRISPEKGPDKAIEIARRAGIPLRIAAKVDRQDRAYFERVIEPLIDGRLVTFVGEVTDGAKQEFLGDALALLFPIDWPEPFGLVMIEAFACGTPVVAFGCGSVPEVMVDGVTGHVVRSVDEAVEAVRRVEALPRAKVREVFEARFTAETMARKYLAIYQRLLAEQRHGRAAA